MKDENPRKCPPAPPVDHDVVIIGAGLSGIGMACHLQIDAAETRFVILEARSRLGGTWDLFRYPGVRSDSDMLTYGYAFRPWHDPEILADGERIRTYIADTAREHGIDRHIRFGKRVTRAAWSSETQCWTLAVTDQKDGAEHRITCRFVIFGTGYYDFAAGYRPEFSNEARFGGIFVHPQNWPEGLDFAEKRVVVIGSGATAVTLVPALARTAGHVTMLQRSPGYVFSVPARDRLAGALARVLPARLVFGLARARNMLMQRAVYAASRRWPQRLRAFLLKQVKRQLGPGADMRHFTPAYNPWDERLSAVPDGDLFRAIRSGKASVVTDHIAAFNETGITLQSGARVEADIVVTATGLSLQVLGGIRVTVDGQPHDLGHRVTYKGVMVDGLPNAGIIIGYTNASWTLRADLSAGYLLRLMGHMRQKGYAVATPRAPGGVRGEDNIMAVLQAGYIHRGDALLPRQGLRPPWRITNDFRADRAALLKDPIDDGALVFEQARRRAASGLAARPDGQGSASASAPSACSEPRSG